MDKKPAYYAKTVTTSGDNKAYFHTIGAAWRNKGGSLWIKLHAYPTNGEILLFTPTEKTENEE